MHKLCSHESYFAHINYILKNNDVIVLCSQ